MGPRRVRWREPGMAHHGWREASRPSGLDVGQTGNVEDERATVDIPDVRAIGMIGPDLRLVGAIAGVDLGITNGQTSGQARVTTASARVPPAADFSRLSRIAEID